MENMAKFQRAEIVRLKEENVLLRNITIKLIKAAKENRATIDVQREVCKNLHGRLQVVNSAYDILREDY